LSSTDLFVRISVGKRNIRLEAAKEHLYLQEFVAVIDRVGDGLEELLVVAYIDIRFARLVPGLELKEPVRSGEWVLIVFGTIVCTVHDVRFDLGPVLVLFHRHLGVGMIEENLEDPIMEGVGALEGGVRRRRSRRGVGRGGR